jgi:hypothetical protein
MVDGGYGDYEDGEYNPGAYNYIYIYMILIMYNPNRYGSKGDGYEPNNSEFHILVLLRRGILVGMWRMMVLCTECNMS